MKPGYRLYKYERVEMIDPDDNPMDKCDMCGEPWDNSTRGHVCL